MKQSLEINLFSPNGFYKKDDGLISSTVNLDSFPTNFLYEKYIIKNVNLQFYEDLLGDLQRVLEGNYKVVFKSSRGHEVVVDQWFRETTLSKLKYPAAYMHYGKFLVDSGRYEEAVNIYLKASQLGVDQYNVVNSAAAALRYAGRYEEAEVFYRIAVSIKPNDATSLSNLGAILHLLGTKMAASGYSETYFKEADSCYRKALLLNPDDVTALVNLSKLRNYIKHCVS